MLSASESRQSGFLPGPICGTVGRSFLPLTLSATLSPCKCQATPLGSIALLAPGVGKGPAQFASLSLRVPRLPRPHHRVCVLGDRSDIF